jgi:hypothetical protein
MLGILLMCAVCLGLRWDEETGFMKFKVYALVLMKIHVFWDVTACRLVDSY